MIGRGLGLVLQSLSGEIESGGDRQRWNERESWVGDGGSSPESFRFQGLALYFCHTEVSYEIWVCADGEGTVCDA